MSDLGPELPANWYLLGRACDPEPGRIAAHTIGGREIIVWRGRDSGAAAAFAGHCAHMGCHLGKGQVVGDRLRCGLHHRLIDATGAFGPGENALRQPTLELSEYGGGLWVRIGEAAQVPPFAALGLEGFSACYAGEHRFALPWQVLVANGFDCEHLEAVHERRLLAPPTLEPLGSGGLVLRYHTQPVGRGLADRITALIGPDGVHGEIASQNGSLMLVRSRLGTRRNFILLSFIPTTGRETIVRGIVGIEGAAGWWSGLQARLAARLFRAFLHKDLAVFEGLAWHEPAREDSLGDRYTRQLCDYLRSLPHG